jgi:hypothetical protein
MCGWGREFVRARGFCAALAALGALFLAVPFSAWAAAPEVKATWVTEVKSSQALLHARINPGGVATTFRFEYITEAAYLANPGEGFAGASRVPVPEELVASGATDTSVARTAAGLSPVTRYRYRVVAKNSGGTVFGPERVLTTLPAFGGPLVLLDNRGWEMVSPVDKNGGEVQGFGANAGGGVLQAAAQGGAMTFSSATSFGAGGEGAPVASQYVSRRSAAGWSAENITAPLFSGGYGEAPNGVPFRLFSTDLTRGLLAGVPYSPLPGTGAPAGYANYYLRDVTGGFTALLTQADVAGLLVPPAEFELAFAGASPDLTHVVLSSCAALTADATEVPAGGGDCDAAKPNLYEWSSGSGPRLLNLLPGDSTGTPPGRLAASSGAVSSDGSRVYWTDGADLYLRQGGQTAQVDTAAGGEGAFQLATPDGGLAFFTKGEHLFRYSAVTGTTLDLTPAGGVKGMLGASSDGSYAYFATAAGISLAHGGSVTPVAAAPDAVNFPPSTGTARVSADGTRLAFVSAAPGLAPYDNTDEKSGKPYDEVYLFDAGAQILTCVSCNPSGEPPRGPASIPGAVANGEGEGATRIYKPRVLSADGRRLFFDSPDRLVPKDGNSDPDVYEWEAGGAGTCTSPQGCLQLISSGRSGGGGASFLDASASGSDVFFLTGESLVRSDPGAADIYNARENGGFAEAPTAIPCEEDACQPLPSPPDDRSPGSLVPSAGNPPIHFPKAKKGKKHKKGKKKRAHRHGDKQQSPRSHGGRR